MAGLKKGYFAIYVVGGMDRLVVVCSWVHKKIGNENPQWMSGDIGVFGVEINSGLSKSSILQPDPIYNREATFFGSHMGIRVNISGILICPCLGDVGRAENNKYNFYQKGLGFDILEVTTFLLRGDRCMKPLCAV